MTPGVNAVDTVEAPEAGFWRVGLAPDPYETREPLTPTELRDPHTGNRFDSPNGNYGVLYFGSTLEVCFGETLARFRPDPRIVRLIKDEWVEDEGFMSPGDVPADWRLRRLAVRATPEPGSVFLDVESAATRAVLNVELAPALSTYRGLDLDVAVVRSGDRRITRAISWWAWAQDDENGDPLYAGVRYVSRLDSDWECWGIFDEIPTDEQERRTILPNMPELQSVAARYGLRIF